MQSGAQRLVRQRFGIVRIAGGAFEDLAALDLPDALRAAADLQAAETRALAIAETLREEAFAAIRGCADVQLRRRLLHAKRDLFNRRRIDATLPLPSIDAYAPAMNELDAAGENFERAFDADVAMARMKLHELANSEALQRPLARSSAALLAEIRRGITRRIEAGLMKYVTRMHVKTSPFSTFCHVAVARFEPGPTSVRLGEARVTVRDEQFEDSVVEGEVVRDIDAIEETFFDYVRDLQSSEDERWTSALSSRLACIDGTVRISHQDVPEPCRNLPRSIAAMLQFTPEGAVLNGCGPGYGRVASRFFDLLPPELLEEQRAMNRGLVEFDDGSQLSINRHPLLVDAVIRDVSDLTVRIGDDDQPWLMRGDQRLEFVDLGLQQPTERSPMHQFLNTVFTAAHQLSRKPMVRAALAVSPRGIMRPRVIYGDRLIIRRRSWHIPKAMLPVRAPRESDASYFARVGAWRESLGIPQYVFAKIRNAKPQFLSFASWHSVRLFEKLIARVNRTLKLQEMLPAPDDMLVWNGRHHAAEFVVQWNRSV
ncbi:MAG TPA: hypothetical protein VII75_08310 [Thermoanaerobaculia bacterium]